MWASEGSGVGPRGPTPRSRAQPGGLLSRYLYSRALVSWFLRLDWPIWLAQGLAHMGSWDGPSEGPYG